MKKSIISLFFIILALGLFNSCNKNQKKRADEVIVYTYDSFCDEWGPGPELTKLFEEKTGKKLSLVSVGDGANLITKAVAEKKYPVADAICGIDNSLLEAALSNDFLEPYKPENYDNLLPELLIDETNRFIPFDYSFFTLIWDSQSGIKKPESLSDLIKPEYKKKIILMSPKTSTPGLGFVLWAGAVFGDKFDDYWKSLKSSVLTMAPSWSTGYGLFTSGEAPLVCSYTTSPAYHVAYDKTDRYQALIFEDGHIMQVEGAGILKTAPNMEGAKLFIDFIISDEAQSIIPMTQWMYPSNKNTVLPDCYKAAPKAQKILTDTSSLSLKKAQSLSF